MPHVAVPPGFTSILEALAAEVLRAQPPNIPEFAARHFTALLRRRRDGTNFHAITRKCRSHIRSYTTFGECVTHQARTQSSAKIKPASKSSHFEKHKQCQKAMSITKPFLICVAHLKCPSPPGGATSLFVCLIVLICLSLSF
uniref:RIIa domain-containing protein n=1 Tax=Denticeps clupeoides TaxID=299321 RepID=A0AAY4AJ08_9TELE